MSSKYKIHDSEFYFNAINVDSKKFLQQVAKTRITQVSTKEDFW